MSRRNPLDGARDKGYSARLKGAMREGNPYRDIRTARGHVTYSRAFRRAWFEGWDSCDRLCAAVKEPA